MALSTVQRLLDSIPKYPPVDVLRALLQTLLRLLCITISILLLPLDNAILLATYFVGHLSLPRSASHRRRQCIIGNTHFHPKTILVTGIDSPHGLAIARCWYYEGHRVIGADVTDLPIRSGGSMSKTLTRFYNVAKAQYVSRLLDIVNREKVDVWIPCSERVDAIDDAVAKQVIESRTECRCIQLDPELASPFGTPDSFTQYLVEKELPVVESHQVQSRHSVHQVLHRSPDKAYVMQRVNPASRHSDSDKPLALPKRTLSLTYSEVSQVQISKDDPWIMQQQTRLGEFVAELLVVRGHVKAIKIRPGDQQTAWGASRLDQGLAIAIHRLMDRFAMKGGPRMTSHLRVHLMVDEEFNANSVRHVLHIAGCRQGAAAVKTLLQNSTSAIASGYLAVLSPQVNEVPGELNEAAYSHVQTTIAATSPRDPNAPKQMPSLHRVVRQLEGLIWEARQLTFWKDARFSYLDPLPWWWHAHVHTPFREIGVVLHREPLKQA